jgi:hypothetical protein
LLGVQCMPHMGKKAKTCNPGVPPTAYWRQQAQKLVY